jgi:signal peptidase II
MVTENSTRQTELPEQFFGEEDDGKDVEVKKFNLIQYIKDYAYLLSIAGIIVFLDQWTKGIVETNLAVGETWMPLAWLQPYVRIVHWWNTGSAFGMFQEASLILTILAVVVSIFIFYYFPQVPARDWPLRVAMSMQLGGALGNLTDRLTIGHVTDFISVGTFPVFNIADSCISLGVAVLLLGLWLEQKRDTVPSEENKDQSGTGKAKVSILEGMGNTDLKSE